MDKKPLLYYRTKEQIKEYRALPMKEKLTWLEEQMKFFYEMRQSLKRKQNE
jgi:hypothetical protein